MFTGIIQESGILTSLKPSENSTDLSIQAGSAFDDAVIGESVAVNGVCLTLVRRESHLLIFNVLNETLRVTNLGHLQIGSRVNLERSLKSSDRMGGHFVTGHVDATGLVKEWSQVGADWRLVVDCPRTVSELCVKKGSIAIDGISLTVADIQNSELLVWIIPHTREVTNLAGCRVGTVVNLEADILGKYVTRILESHLPK
ncbi:riboflavin synthase [Oscillatoria amoena NRMC-F 0135]|nr:riboflavin synthase [Oscillatoria laete-virens]MDL5047226.1 riboflavin synthase [Oscillatoria amoena NRMC-F 0135]MDL5052544.1 riboflavin synthase [Oscillatoria laete-virens NRMC-F 0139]